MVILNKFFFKIHGLALAWWLAGLALVFVTPGQAGAEFQPVNYQGANSALSTMEKAAPKGLGGAAWQDLLGGVSSERLAAGVQRLSQFSRCLTDPGHAEAG